MDEVRWPVVSVGTGTLTEFVRFWDGLYSGYDEDFYRLNIGQTPRENTFRPRLSATAQWSPASFTRRVRAASPGGSSTQPSGTVRTFPSADRTVSGVGPGVKVWSLIARRRPPCHGRFIRPDPSRLSRADSHSCPL
jgi:hypothetical protein